MAFTPFFEGETTLFVLHRTTLCSILTFFNLDVIKKFFASFEFGLAAFFISGIQCRSVQSKGQFQSCPCRGKNKSAAQVLCLQTTL